MNFFPQFSQIKTHDELQSYASTYLSCSGLPIPDHYLYNPNNRVFGIYWQKELIGGFILGNGPEFRTVNVFAQENSRESVYSSMHEKSDTSNYTEITCFWIKRQYRTKTFLNFFTWLSMAYALKRYGKEYFLFGTCSRSLSRLYATTPKSVLVHRDFINKKPTFIFWAKRSGCISGILEIVKFKLKRVLNNSRLSINPFRYLKQLNEYHRGKG